MSNAPKRKLSKPRKGGVLEALCTLEQLGDVRIDSGWSNSAPEQIDRWLKMKKIDVGAKNRNRYVTEPWWCQAERRAKCVKAGKCLRGNCKGTRKEKFKACRKVQLFQVWGYYEI